MRLLTAWDEYADEKTTENDRPDMFDDDQLYVVFVFDDGGTDLENFSFRNATQVLTKALSEDCHVAWDKLPCVSISRLVQNDFCFPMTSTNCW